MLYFLKDSLTLNRAHLSEAMFPKARPLVFVRFVEVNLWSLKRHERRFQPIIVGNLLRNDS